MKTPKKFRKKPIVIEAIQWTGKNTKEIEEFVGKKLKEQKHPCKDIITWLIIPTPESPHEASINDWIIKGTEGEFYPCKDKIFKDIYEEV